MKYIRKVSDIVEAAEFTHPLSNELFKILNSKIGLFYFDNRNRLYIMTPLKNKLVNIGDMVVLLPSGLLDCMNKDVFNSKYEVYKE